MGEIAEAIMAVIVTVLIVIVAAVVVSIVISIVKVWYYNHQNNNNNPPPSTNSVVHVQIVNGSTVIAGYIAPTYGQWATQQNVYDLSPEPIPGFALQYGVDINTNPWIAVAGQNVPQNEVGYVTSDQNYFAQPQSTNDLNLPTNYVFALTLNGVGTVTYQATNDTQVAEETDLNNSNLNQTVTNSYGDVATFTPTPYPQSTNCVIILRSTNLLTWENIYTDYVSPGEVRSYTDTNIFLPTEVTFYNTNNGGSGGGLVPPGDTNNAGTNGVYYLPGRAFYRLAYPSNQPDYFVP